MKLVLVSKKLETMRVFDHSTTWYRVKESQCSSYLLVLEILRLPLNIAFIIPLLGIDTEGIHLANMSIRSHQICYFEASSSSHPHFEHESITWLHQPLYILNHCKEINKLRYKTLIHSPCCR